LSRLRIKSWTEPLFERDNELSDAELLARALWCTQHLQMDPKALDRFFEDQFGIAAITQGELGPWLALMMMTNVEEQIKAAAGGRN
jgi:hypothetical protein